ncbi:zinc metalloproteinase nas-13 isoform X2 [Apis mellifera]|uniref:Metalloendopeptidase n=1 Tax=Apis mellifera TaxID=7460 RepID=A0A7M7GMI9_APIME|nr:zinc metalloproteinase nas-13 isoform X2 [Apis mellifera]|eukprot:XP_006557885.2 zinc metalloproteinase nas-13 isoform X2 [Apis mellifera]
MVFCANRIKSWRKTDKQNIWELSGLYEGDIMTTEEDEIKNGLIKTAFRWPGGVVPYYIKEEDFDEEDIEVIKNAIEDYHQNTCIRFRPYEKSDIDYITIEAKSSGCWSLVGRHDRGQVVNLQNPGCVQHGVIVHELMHALGFYHQQSAADRDEWVAINWENIKPGREHNFNKYDNRTVTDYGIGYDYDSIMHYSSYAFSKNGEPTITPKKKNVKLGQRKELSEKDTLKLREMYKEECGKREMNGTAGNNSMDDISIEWILSKKL